VKSRFLFLFRAPFYCFGRSIQGIDVAGKAYDQSVNVKAVHVHPALLLALLVLVELKMLMVILMTIPGPLQRLFEQFVKTVMWKGHAAEAGQELSKKALVPRLELSLMTLLIRTYIQICY
jgi:hypothetical protein